MSLKIAGISQKSSVSTMKAILIGIGIGTILHPMLIELMLSYIQELITLTMLVTKIETIVE